MKLKFLFIIHLAFALSKSLSAQTPSIAYGPPKVCPDQVAIYAVNPSGCTFNYWEWSGTASIPTGSITTTRTERIDLKWISGGQLLANCTCTNSAGDTFLSFANIMVSVLTPPSKLEPLPMMKFQISQPTAIHTTITIPENNPPAAFELLFELALELLPLLTFAISFDF